MKIDIANLFEGVNQALGKNNNKSINEHPSEIADMVFRTQIVDDFAKILANFESASVLNEVNYDLFTSIYFALNGLYRNSFSSLRSASELGLCFFYFTDYNFHYQKWKKNNIDITWTMLSDQDKGVLNSAYLCNVYKFDKCEKLVSDYDDIYRHCSEFVHGKYSYMHTINDAQIVYDSSDFLSFHKTFIQLTNLLFSIMILRFNDKLVELREEKFTYIQEISKVYSLNQIIPEYGK